MNLLSQRFQEKPQKQGGLYSLNLGQNNGPYLPKDIMLTNQKSLKLLQNDEVSKSTSSILAKAGMGQLQEPPDIYDEKTKQFVNYDEKYKTKMSASDNVAAMSLLYTASIKSLVDGLKEYKDLIKQTEVDKIQYTFLCSIIKKDELKAMNERINTENINNIKDLQPMLKEFHNKLKERLHEEKNENYKLLREIEGLNREKLSIQQTILFSHKRIMELEKLVGIQHKVEQFDDNIEEEDDDQKSESQFSDSYN